MLGIFGLATLIQILFWGVIFGRLARRKVWQQPTLCTDGPLVSVVICARNEAHNLEKNLCHFLNQSYRSFEVIVVNDHSSDNTAQVVLEAMAKWPNLRLVNLIQDTPPGKKAALAKGIEAAQGNYLLLSDADCRPASPDWIAAMRAHTNTISEIGLGFSPYDRYEGWLNRFIRYETAYTVAQYWSLALWGMPYMGVGRNLWYNRSLYERAGGFDKHWHIASGDDDLFVNAVANRQNTAIVPDERAFVYSAPKRDLRGYYYQKRRHLSTGRSYKPLHQLVLGMLSASHWLHYAAALGALAWGVPLGWVGAGVCMRAVVVCYRWSTLLRQLHQSDLLPHVLWLDAGMALYYVIMAPALWFRNKNRWI